jgi:hypothetical protein
VRFLGFSVGGDSLIARFAAPGDADRRLVFVRLGRDGAVLDIQTADGAAGSTGDGALDAIVTALAAEELRTARAAAVVSTFDMAAGQ